MYMEKEHDSGEVLLYESRYVDGKQVRVYDMDDSWHSAVYVEPGHHFDLVFEYTKKFNLIFEHIRKDASILMIGGGAYSCPKYMISHYPGTKITVVDIDPESFRIAEKYFFLDELIEQYDPIRKGRLVPVTLDGRYYLETSAQTFDAIIDDAFYGFMPVFELKTYEAMESIKEHLNPGGIYCVNLPGYMDLNESEYLLRTLKTAQQVFRHVLLVQAYTPGSDITCNYVMFASDTCDHLSDMMEFDVSGCDVIYDEELDDLRENYDF